MNDHDSQPAAHRRRILDQFTRQAVPFSEVPQHREAASMALTLETLALSADDEVLDVACGPGLLALAMAPHCRRVTGVDLTPAMVARARELAAAGGVRNVQFAEADAAALPYAEGAFPVVVTRYSFHHLLEPGRVLAEMRRVCGRGGRVAVIDVTPPAGMRAAYDERERWRDPSHTSALTEEELLALGEAAGLRVDRRAAYRLAAPVEGLLASSFPPEGGAARFREALAAEAAGRGKASGFQPEWREGALWLSFPLSIVVWERED